jgi:diguanylate cyclase (GGDEF)-like protein
MQNNKILIIEDSSLLTNFMLNEINAQFYYEIVTATSRYEAKRLLRKNADLYFCALVDLNLPDAPNGEAVQDVIYYDIPILIFTDNEDTLVRKALLEQGVVEYALKNNRTNFNYLLRLIRRLDLNRTKKVLLIGEDTTYFETLIEYLELFGFNILYAPTVVLSLQILKENKDIEIAICDQNFYKNAQLSDIHLIRSEYPHDVLSLFSLLPIGRVSNISYLLKNGFSDVLTYPLDKENVIAKLTQQCEIFDAINKAKEASITDFLTKLYNRRHFFEEGTLLLENAKRGAIRLSLGMIDIDKFKDINDTYGHQIGDLALKHVSKSLQHNFRKADLVARIGGEEFAVLAINADGAMGYQLFDRLRQNLEKNPLVVNSKTIPITISIGLTHIVQNELTLMLQKADEYLYKAKSTCRNRTVVS